MKTRPSHKHLITVCACLIGTQALAEIENRDTEGPWIGGVFDARDKSSSATPIQHRPSIDTSPIIDSDGNTNLLIIMPDYANSSLIDRLALTLSIAPKQYPEDILLEAI